MNTRAPRSAFASVGRGALDALQWRLVIVWMLVTLLPTLVVALPLWKALDELLAHSVHAQAWAVHFDGLMFGDVYESLRGRPQTGAAFLAGLLLMLTFAPFLTGMAVATGRAGRALGFGALLQGGATEYGRQLRLSILALLPYAVFFAVARGVSSLADDRVDMALLESHARWYQYGGMAVIAACFGIVQAVVESARAQFIADIGLRSAFRAMGRGLLQVGRRPFANLFAYAAITIVGGAGSVAVAAWRGHTTAVGMGVLGAFLIVQLGVAIVAWTKTARLLALASLATTNPAHRRRRTDFAPAL
ncbi:MAG: hypothetical protein GAK28_00013 [Luteibacter sp.]|uniref:hypothetical protein n=1 Tax=Luteibacter sp. TaxID=1886636 RepID=UPI0013833814|nr:hypothetical protein [Luteibacter sp.]KAF1009376.1 MAG: hypothetical protein GAK28_00013 [Luteibacter sp.]